MLFCLMFCYEHIKLHVSVHKLCIRRLQLTRDVLWCKTKMNKIHFLLTEQLVSIMFYCQYIVHSIVWHNSTLHARNLEFTAWVWMHSMGFRRGLWLKCLHVTNTRKIRLIFRCKFHRGRKLLNWFYTMF